MMGRYNTYSVEQEEFLKESAPLMSRKELTERFNEKFGTTKNVRAIKSYCNNRGYNSSSDGRFQDGNISWQTGLSKDDFKAHYTEESFKRMTEKMIESNKTKKIGDEIIKDGQPFVIVSTDYSLPHDKRRQPKRRVVWERRHGEIPKDHCIICLDGDPMNCEPSNLYCMPIRFRTILAKNQWWFGNAELTLTAIKWCELYYALLRRTKENELQVR